MFKRILLLPFILLLLIPGSLYSQLKRGSADYADLTEYEIAGSPDSVFIFFGENSDKYILATSPNGDSATFDWSYYDEGSGSFQPLTSVTDTISQITITENRCYRVQINGNGNNYEGRCWALINDFAVEIYNGEIIDWEGEQIKAIPESHQWCHLIRDIRARIDSADLGYINPDNGDPYKLELVYPGVRSNWTTRPVPGEPGINYFFQNDEYFLEIDIEDPYWEDSWYILRVTDNYGMSRSDSIFNETIEPHADYTYSYIRLDDSTYYPDRIERYYTDFYGSAYEHISAPALFMFENLSVNGDTITWEFGDSLIEHSRADSVLHTYRLPGSYYPKLIAYNVVEHLYDVCADTFPKSNEEITGIDYPVVVEESEMTPKASLPNVFSCPDGENNYFRFIGDVSITFFEIAIYNRYGKRVYHFKGDIRDWDGWDGMDNNSKNYVHTGVYYYVVKEIKTLPDFETGRKPNLSNPPGGNETGGGTSNTGDQTANSTGADSNTLYKGFVHVYNTQR